MTALAVTAAVLLALVLAGVIYQAVGLARDARRFPRPGQLVDVGGYRLHAVCHGRGSPTVVLESAIAASSLSWSGVQAAVARFTRVCAYDRAGLGWSDASTAPRSRARIIDELHALLVNMNCAGPYVLVGHSFGALVCLAYATQYPRSVSGLVLLDPPSEWVHADPRRARLLRGAIQLSRVGECLARLGVVRVCLALLAGGAPAAPRRFVRVFGPMAARTIERLVGEVRKLPAEMHPVVQALWCQPKCFRAMADQLRGLQEVAASVAQCGPLGEVPLVVISSSDQRPEIMALHDALARTSTLGRHIVASKSGHWVPFDEPELVVDTIREVVEASRRTQVLTTRPNAC